MEAQAYNDGTLRIFDRYGKMICDMKCKVPLKSEADKQLRRLRLKRREKWKDADWGSYAKIRFGLYR